MAAANNNPFAHARMGTPFFNASSQSPDVAETFVDAFEVFTTTAQLDNANRCKALRFSLLGPALIWLSLIHI